MAQSRNSFICETCGKTHVGMPTDSAYALPDDVWAIPEVERGSRAKWTSDLCQMGERYFIRSLLQLPFEKRDGYYGWGVWVEVAWPTFERYLELYESDATNEPVAEGRLANSIPTYEETSGLPVQMHFGTSTARPTLSFAGNPSHKLAQEATVGMTETRYHEILVARGVANEP